MRDKGNRNRSSRKAQRKTPAPMRRTRSHPLFGEIPMTGEIRTTAAGEEYELWSYDPGYQPAMPEGAVRGDPRRQEFCPMCHVPRYFYVDQHRTCVQCDADFAFSAREQKHWYESLRFHFDSVAIRCVDCRRKRRSEHALREQIGRARRAIDAAPDEPRHHLDLAEAIVRYHRMTSDGKLSDAVAAARRAGRLWPNSVAATFWEAAAHDAAGRPERARPLYESVAACPGKGRSRASLVREARDALERLDGGCSRVRGRFEMDVREPTTDPGSRRGPVRR